MVAFFEMSGYVAAVLMPGDGLFSSFFSFLILIFFILLDIFFIILSKLLILSRTCLFRSSTFLDVNNPFCGDDWICIGGVYIDEPKE